MTDKTQKLSIRLLRDGTTPEQAVKENVELADFALLADAKIALGSSPGGAAKWADFLGLTIDQKKLVMQRSAFGLLLLPVASRLFAISWGFGHAKLDEARIEQDFGLRVVLNAVDHRKLKSADVRTPDANTLNRRSQTSRAAERTAFDIDPERDIVRGLAGEPKDRGFATWISGADGLTVTRKAALADLPALCEKALQFHGLEEYKTEFGWIDQVRHVRERVTLDKLQGKLVEALTAALQPDANADDDLALAFPTIYDPERGNSVMFRGYSAQTVYPDLEIEHYLAGLKSKSTTAYDAAMLDNHKVQECDEDGKTPGQTWKIGDCLVFETNVDGNCYTLSGGRWYRIDADLIKDVTAYFAGTEKVDLPAAQAGENEQDYNARLAADASEMLCLDAKLVRPADGSSAIEVCDFLGKDKRLIHIKDKAASSRLSHLFNQGLVSAVTLRRHPAFRDGVKARIAEQPLGADYSATIAGAAEQFTPADYKAVFGVLVNPPAQGEPKLPFFSLISFRHAARGIEEMGYKVAFAWIKKAGAGAGKPVKRVKKNAALDDGVAEDEGV